MTQDEARQTERPAPPLLQGWWRVLRITYLRFGFSVSVLMAAAIAFFSLICLAPLGILLAAVLQFVLGPGSDVYLRIQEAMNGLGPETAARIMPQVDMLLHNPEAHVASVVSVIALIWAGSRLFEILERALTDIWPGKVLRSYLGRKLMALAMMVVAGVLLGGFVLLVATLATVQSWLNQIPEVDSTLVRAMRPRFLLLYQFLLAYLAFALLYKFMPVQRVPSRAALWGAGAAAVLWQIASIVFSWVIRHSQHHSSLYGGLAGIVVFCIWTFLGAQMLLIGGHFAVAYEHVFRERHPREEDEELIGWPEGRMRAALAARSANEVDATSGDDEPAGPPG